MKQLLIMIDDEGNITYPLNLQKAFPYSSFPSVITNNSLPPGVQFVIPTPKPSHLGLLENQRVVEGHPIFNGTQWIQQWDIIEYDLELAEEKTKLCEEAIQRSYDQQLKQLLDSIDNKYSNHRKRIREYLDSSDFPSADIPEIE